METLEVMQDVEKKGSEIDQFISEVVVPTVETQEQHDEAAGLAKTVRKRWKDMEEWRVSTVKPFNDGVKKINNGVKPLIERLQIFETGIKHTCTSWQKEQEKIALDEQRKLDEIARKERERIEAQARLAREKEEAARIAEAEARRKAQEATDAAERKKLEAEAERKKKQAEAAAAKAEVKESVASTVVAPVFASKSEKKGIYTVDIYTAKVMDKSKFIQWVLSSNMLEYLTVNESLLNKEARATKGERQWPGVEIIKTYDSRMKE